MLAPEDVAAVATAGHGGDFAPKKGSRLVLIGPGFTHAGHINRSHVCSFWAFTSPPPSQLAADTRGGDGANWSGGSLGTAFYFHMIQFTRCQQAMPEIESIFTKIPSFSGKVFV